jgi:hypothetical protein
VNLLDRAFEQVTDEQLAAFQLKTDIQRMDSTMVGATSVRWGVCSYWWRCCSECSGC